VEPCKQIRNSAGHRFLLCYSDFLWVLHLGIYGIPVSLVFSNPVRLGTSAERARRDRISTLLFLQSVAAPKTAASREFWANHPFGVGTISCTVLGSSPPQLPRKA
jgi:hypothetical protein